MIQHIDRSEDINMHCLPLTVASTDYCRFFDRRNDTIFKGYDCWHCKYGYFGIDTETPTEQGYCKYQKDNS